MDIVKRFFKSLISCFKKSNNYEYQRLNTSESINLGEYSAEYFSHLEDDNDETGVIESVFESKISDVPPQLFTKSLINEDVITKNTSVDLNKSLVVMSYNISTNSQTYDWNNRQQNISKIINDIDADIITLYECHTLIEDDLINFMKKKLPNYISLQFVGGNDCYILISVNKEKFDINYHGMKWLSSTPDTKSSLWNTNETKIIAFLNVTEKKSGKKYWIFSTQLCKNNKNKILLSTLVSEIIKKISNMDPESSIIFICDENFTGINFNIELIKSFTTNLDKMIHVSTDIYAMLNKYKVRINGNSIGYKTSQTVPYIKNNTYGHCMFAMTKHINSSICYTLFLNNSIENQPSSYLPLILYFS